MALRYWRPGGTGNWNSTTNWSDTPTGVTGSTVPSAIDDVFFTSNSGSGTATVTSGALCKSINLTSFGGSLAMSNSISVSGDVTIGAGMVSAQITGVGSFTINANSTFDILNGVVIPNIAIATATSGVNVTITLVRDVTITNFTSTQNGPNTVNSFLINRTSVGNGDNLFITGNFTHNANLILLTGTSKINFITSTTSVLSNTSSTVISVIINATGTLTGTLYKNGGTLVRTAGTVSGVNLTIYGCTITSNGAIWGNITSPAINSSTITTNDDLICTGTFAQANSYFVAWVHNSSSVVRMRGTSALINSRGLSVVFDGSQNCSIISGNQINTLDMTFNPFSGCQLTIGAFTLSGGGNTITYLDSNGGPVPLSTGLLTFNSTTIMNTTPSISKYIIWNSFTIVTSGATLTLTTDLHVSFTTAMAGNFVLNTSTGSKLYMGGTNAIPTSYAISGTAIIVLYYTGTLQTNGGTISSNILISPNTGQTYTISSLIKSGNGSSITYTSGGGVINATSGTLTIIANITIATGSMSWGNVTTANNTTITIN
jgi:hypothetical protein